MFCLCLMGNMWKGTTARSYLRLDVVVFVRILTHIFTKDISRVFVRSDDIRGLPFIISVMEYYRNNAQVLAKVTAFIPVLL